MMCEWNLFSSKNKTDWRFSSSVLPIARGSDKQWLPCNLRGVALMPWENKRSWESTSCKPAERILWFPDSDFVGRGNALELKQHKGDSRDVDYSDDKKKQGCLDIEATSASAVLMRRRLRHHQKRSQKWSTRFPGQSSLWVPVMYLIPATIVLSLESTGEGRAGGAYLEQFPEEMAGRATG